MISCRNTDNPENSDQHTVSDSGNGPTTLSCCRDSIEACTIRGNCATIIFNFTVKLLCYHPPSKSIVFTGGETCI